MHGLFATLASAAMFSAAVATPVEKRVGNFSVLQTKNEKFVANGPMAYAKAYTKFGKTMPADLAAAVSGTVKASPEDAYDSEYLCPVSIGGQTLSLDFDTGSADLYAVSSFLPAAYLRLFLQLGFLIQVVRVRVERPHGLQLRLVFHLEGQERLHMGHLLRRWKRCFWYCWH